MAPELETTTGTIGIRREDKDHLEKRAPLTPQHVQNLVTEHGIRVVVQPGENRIFPEAAYRQAGAEVSDDLSACNLIFGVKEIPEAALLPEKAYCFFSHTIKGQAANMPLLRRILSLRCTLLDYERVVNRHGERLIHFGRFAGLAGMVDALWVLGQRLRWEGIETPFLQLKQARHYSNLSAAKQAVQAIAEQIARDKLPAANRPVVCGFTGSGNVARGAQEIFDLLAPAELTPEALLEHPPDSGALPASLYKVVFRRHHRMRLRHSQPGVPAPDPPVGPEAYESCFEQYLPHLTLLINGIYWEPGHPRLVTEAFLRDWYRRDPQPRLRVIGDIANDVRGSIECNHRVTTLLDPVYVYDPLSHTTRDGWEGRGPVILAVDKLPTEFPVEASQAFGDALLPFVPELVRVDFARPFETLALPAAFQHAVIAHQGSLTPAYRYLESYL